MFLLYVIIHERARTRNREKGRFSFPPFSDTMEPMSQTRENRIFIIGAGLAGRSLAREVQNKQGYGKVIAFLDDDPEKIGESLEGIPVLGPLSSVTRILGNTGADEALIAIPSATREVLSRIYTLLSEAGFSRIRLLPGISQIIKGDAHLIQARDIDPQDLLGRNPVAINLKDSLSYLRGKRVLITGAGGSIGSELSRQLLSGGAERLYLMGHGENSIYGIERELNLLQEEGVGEKATIVPVIGELQDRDYVNFIIKRLRADVIFHCAAHKHVPLMEANPVESVKNNVFGTLNLVEALKECPESRLVLISTDKAVDPSCVYGASKALAERIVLSSGSSSMVVRFGNVLGSRGSIIPLFKKQILKGGPVTLTHPEATRYFMTIPEACSLVLKTGGVGKKGHLYVLDMGEPILIKDMARQMIRFYGHNPDAGEIPLVSIGLRPGEKLHEKLWTDQEEPRATEYPRIMMVQGHHPDRENWSGLIERLYPACYLQKGKEDLFRNRRYLKNQLVTYFPTMEAPGDDEPEY